jgi:hypothetical protein
MLERRHTMAPALYFNALSYGSAAAESFQSLVSIAQKILKDTGFDFNRLEEK